MDGSANLCRETRHEARQLADSGHNLTRSLRGENGAHPTPSDGAKDDVSRTTVCRQARRSVATSTGPPSPSLPALRRRNGTARAGRTARCCFCRLARQSGSLSRLDARDLGFKFGNLITQALSFLHGGISLTAAITNGGNQFRLPPLPGRVVGLVLEVGQARE